ncbi:hypothetical protein Pfo_007060 [Paulownia fortunei]|nr:hypothetical protein Pfo_007060 [Paulownia fortunei]
MAPFPGDLGALIFIGALVGMTFLLYLVEKCIITFVRDNQQYSQTQRLEIARPMPATPPQRPLGRKRLASNDIIVFHTYIQENSKEDGVGGCAICLEEYKDGETRAAITACNHRYHACCIKAWLGKNDTCPLCRTHVV